MKDKESSIKPFSVGNYIYKNSNYNMIDKYKDDMNRVIPNIILEFEHVNKKDKIIVDIICWKRRFFCDFNINNYILTNKGIVPMNYKRDDTFTNILYDMIENKSKLIVNLQEIQNKAFPEYSIERNIKMVYLNELYSFLRTQYLKCLQNNYIVYGIVPSIKVERKEECHFTNCNPPYPKLLLECNHWISFMAYKGIINKTENDYTESIRCPFCRNDLKIKFSKVEL